MKNLTTLAHLFFFVVVINLSGYSQQICLVSSDYQNGEHYMVAWEKPLDLTGLDSVLIYKSVGSGTIFTRIGAIDMNDLSVYTDLYSNTMDTMKYAISFLDSSGNESPLSNWHQGVVLDFMDGMLIWTKYKKQNQIDESYIYSYECMRDQTGFGAFTSMGYWGNYQTFWQDPTAYIYPNTEYYIETGLPNCSITKANINTSRSNIKKQFSNSEASLVESKSTIQFNFSPNPVNDQMNVTLDANFVGATYTVTDASGKIIFSGNINSKEITLNTGDLQKGNYFMNIDSKGKIFSKVFMKI